MACRPGAAPSGAGFGDLRALAGARHVLRPPGIAPGSPDWQSGTLLLRYNRFKAKKNKHPRIKLRPQDYTGGAFRDFRNPLSFLSLYEIKNPTRLSRVGLGKIFSL